MDLEKIAIESTQLVRYLATRELKADEKIASLKTTAALIEHVVQIESMMALTKSFLKREGR